MDLFNKYFNVENNRNEPIPLPLIQETMRLLGYERMSRDLTTNGLWFATFYGEKKGRFPHKLFLGSKKYFLYVFPITLKGLAKVGYKSGLFEAFGSFLEKYKQVRGSYIDKDRVMITLKRLGFDYIGRRLHNLHYFCRFMRKDDSDNILIVVDLRGNLADLKAVETFIRDDGVRRNLFSKDEFKRIFNDVPFTINEAEVEDLRKNYPECSPYA